MRPFAVTCLLLAALSAAQADPVERFETRVRPLLAKNCLACHTQSAMGGLRMDSREALLKGGASGPAIVPGEPDQGTLLAAVRHTHERLRMPPAGKLKESDIEELATWVKDGAAWGVSAPAPATAAKTGEYVITPEQRAFWSFQPVRRPEPPAVLDAAWATSTIDRFILARLEAEGLRPVRQADKRTLIRRATLALTGLLPTPAEVNTFLADDSADAFAKVVDGLLASPHYGERWGRHWLDVARYADESLESTEDKAYAHSHRYRDWVVRALNEDMPYHTFVKAQIAGDLLPAKDPQQYAAGLGFYALSPEMQDDRVDATTRGFLGLTVACAQCHDHKFDPIPTKDYYSLQGVFTSSEKHELPLAPANVVAAWQAQKKAADKKEAELKRFHELQALQLGEMLAHRTADYLLATREGAPADGLDDGVLTRWRAYLKTEQKDHPFLRDWFALARRNASLEEIRPAALAFQAKLLEVIEEKRRVDDENHVRLGVNPDRNTLSQASLVSLARDQYVLWQDFFTTPGQDSGGVVKRGNGVLRFGPGQIDRFLTGPWLDHLKTLKQQVADARKALPTQYPFLHSLKDDEKPADVKVALRGDRNNLGDIAPRRFLAILSPAERAPFQKGSGRLELAEAIANPANPLTARVMVNRVWQWHFGEGIVRTPSNFGQLGERPTHPELLDWLADEFVQQGWSLKALHRTIMLSATWQLSAANDAANAAKDPGNRLLWRAHRQRMDAETLRDTMLHASGELDATVGGPAAALDAKHRRRTLYGAVSRRKLDGTLALFDFPNPNSTGEQRIATNVPLQRLYFMNSPFVEERAQALAQRLTDDDDTARITQAYQILYGRDPDADELAAGQRFVQAGTWPQYARVLLAANEFSFID